MRNRRDQCSGAVEGNSTYSVVRLPDGKEGTASTSDLAPYPSSHNESEDPPNTDCTLPETNGVGDDMRGETVDEAADGVREDSSGSWRGPFCG